MKSCLVNQHDSATEYTRLRGFFVCLLRDCPVRLDRSAILTLVDETICRSYASSRWIDLVRNLDFWLADSSVNLSPDLRLFGVREDMSAHHLRWVRQFLRSTWKMDTGAEPVDPFNASFRKRITRSGSPDSRSIYYIRAKEAIHRLFGRMPVPPWDALKGRHGPGAVSSGERTFSEKMDFGVIPKSLLRETGLEFWRLNQNHLDAVPLQKVSRLSVTKVVAVPKDVRGPRIISEEPAATQFAQQALWAHLERQLSKYAPTINFRDQLKHREHLRMASMSSLDLKDASDMVSRRLVWNLFPPVWRRYLFAARSSFCQVGNETLPIRAYAPMGSALCFPIESVVHWAAIQAALADIPTQDRKAFSLHSVYGDDLIVHSCVAGSVMSALRALGLVPNVAKCFINRRFRESCGLDLYLSSRPEDVTPGYIRVPLHVSLSRSAALSLVYVQNHLCRNGFTAASTYLAHLISSALLLETRAVFSPPVCYPVLLDPLHDKYLKRRWNKSFQRLEVRTWVLSPRLRKDDVDGWPALFSSVGLCLRVDELSVRPRVEDLRVIKSYRRTR